MVAKGRDEGEGAMVDLHLRPVRATEPRARTEGRKGMGAERLGPGDLGHPLTEVWSPVCTGKRG